MHSILALSATHERYLRSFTPERPSVLKIYHFTKSLVLFNQGLSQHLLHTEDQHTLSLTATFLGMSTIASIHSSTHKETWPSSHTEPESPRMAEGKEAV